MGAYETAVSRNVSVSVKCYEAKTVYVVIKNSDGNVMEEAEFTQSDNGYSYRLETILKHNSLYTVTVIADYGTPDERVETDSFIVIDTYKQSESEQFQETEDEESYLMRSLKSAVLGNYSDDCTLGGVLAEIGLGLVPYIGQTCDIRDVSYDITNWEWSWSHAGYTFLDCVGFIPGPGDAFKALFKHCDVILVIFQNGKQINKVYDGTSTFFERTIKEAAENGGQIAGMVVKDGDEVVEVGLKRVTKNADEVADAVEEVIKGKASYGFKSGISELLLKHNLSMDEFNSLRLKDVSTLTDAEKTTLKAIRESVPTPNADTLLQKVIPTSDIEKYMNGTYTKIGGYITRADDVAHLSTYDDFYNGLRLDYPNSVYNPTVDNSVGVIRCTTEETSKISIPYSTEMGGNTSGAAPFTGNGFTKATNGEIIPEFKCDDYLEIEDGAQLIEISKDGKEKLKAVYSKVDKMFVPIE